MKKIKFNIALFVIGLLLIVVSLGKQLLSDDNRAPIYGGTYISPTPDRVSTIDPRKVVWGSEKDALLLIFDSIIYLNSQHKRESICESWSMNDNSTRFTCNINTSIRFHDGSFVSYDDVLFSFNYILAKGGLDIEDFSSIMGIDNFWNGEAKRINGINIVNGKLEIILKNSNPFFPNLLASKRIVLLPDSLNGLEPDVFFRNPIGTGPYKFEKLDDSQISVVVNEDYYAGRPFLDRVIIKTMDVKDAINEFKQRKVHDLRYFELTADPGEFKYSINVPSSSYTTLVLFPNNSVFPFNNIENRELLFSLFDLKATLKKCDLHNGLTTSIIPSGIMGFEDHGYLEEYDFQKAIELISKNKLNQALKAHVKIYYARSQIRDCIGNVVNSNFEKLNIPWRTVGINSDKLVELFFQKKTLAHYEGLDVKNDDAYTILKYFDSKSVENLAYIKNIEIDLMLEKSKEVYQHREKSIIYKKISRRILDEKMVLPIYESGNLVMYDMSVHSTNGVLNNRTKMDYTQIWLSDSL